ncbi:MotA/TolQ/ExbB proton channel family protein [Argonema antarcticum]|uniref:MotA/TolQ/ExbB proton channel family protein n=1 Tax=Argonema antarcticum TaxID=2942763 RepID=UPI0020112AEB|nr:MotA/TolQ/ExbB proton channel family protein [Argonema antarcticum A004/B2]
MNNLEIFRDGGPSMWPLLVLSILSLSAILERLWFWTRILTRERDIVNRVLDAANQDWGTAAEIARRSTNKPIGRFLYAPLRLYQPEPEVFRLALETAAEEELGDMRRGDKILEAVIALAPLLGLFGTVWGLIVSLRDLRISDIGTAAASEATLGIGQALISTASGLVVAIFSLAFYRLFQVFLFNQIKIFRKSGNELELLYRQFWSQSQSEYRRYAIDNNSVTPDLPKARVDSSNDLPKPKLDSSNDLPKARVDSSNDLPKPKLDNSNSVENPD